MRFSLREVVDAVVEDLADRRVERDRDVVAGRVARGLDALDQRLQRRLVGLEVGREAALVADGGVQAALLERRLQRVEDLGAHPQALGEARRADRDDHELLEVHRVVRVGAAVEDVHHRHRQDVRRFAAEVAPQRQVLLGRGRPRGRERDAEDGVRAQARLVLGAVELDQLAVEARLVERVVAGDRLGDLAVDVADGLRDALAAVGVAAVAQLGGLELAGGGTGGDRGATVRAGAQVDLDLDGGVAAGVKDLACVDRFDLAHLAGHDTCLPGSRLRRGSTQPTFACTRHAEPRPRESASTLVPLAPSCAASSSAASTRPWKRSLDARSASSGSTFSLRATLTAANSTSPTSWKRSSRVEASSSSSSSPRTPS